LFFFSIFDQNSLQRKEKKRKIGKKKKRKEKKRKEKKRKEKKEERHQSLRYVSTRLTRHSCTARAYPPLSHVTKHQETYIYFYCILFPLTQPDHPQIF
jgi:predicted O-linked N-acetylglucosamine transferase (SPINDLY family)